MQLPATASVSCGVQTFSPDVHSAHSPSLPARQPCVSSVAARERCVNIETSSWPWASSASTVRASAPSGVTTSATGISGHATGGGGVGRGGASGTTAVVAAGPGSGR